jgi:hypothetical protein
MNYEYLRRLVGEAQEKLKGIPFTEDVYEILTELQEVADWYERQEQREYEGLAPLSYTSPEQTTSCTSHTQTITITPPTPEQIAYWEEDYMTPEVPASLSEDV